MYNNKIFILGIKKSKKYSDTTYCIAVFKLGTPFMEFIMGVTDDNRECKRGDEVSYVYKANYTSDIKYAVEWLSKVE